MKSTWLLYLQVITVVQCEILAVDTLYCFHPLIFSASSPSGIIILYGCPAFVVLSLFIDPNFPYLKSFLLSLEIQPGSTYWYTLLSN